MLQKEPYQYGRWSLLLQLQHPDHQTFPYLKYPSPVAAHVEALPFRGFSRSGATISTALFLGISRQKAEEFSFALAVVLTPAVIAKELLRLVHAQQATVGASHLALGSLLLPSLFGMVFSFLTGLLALKWLSAWLEHGRWYLFGIYCLVFSGVVLSSA